MTKFGPIAGVVRPALRHVGAATLTLWLISLLVFLGANIRPPEDVARQALGRTVTEGQLREFIEVNGLDRSVPERYVAWFGDYLRGDWGHSVSTDRDVRQAVTPRLWRSLVLAVVATVVAVPISLLVGIFTARRLHKRADLTTNVALAVLSALPEFVIGLALTTIFAVYLGWLPVDSTAIEYGTATEHALAYVLPTITLVLLVVPYIARVTRAALIDTLHSSYSRAAVLRGLAPRTVLWDYSVRNASVPILNAIAVNFVYLLGGVIVVENVFGFPGIGQLIVQSIGRADVIVVQGAAMALGGLVVVVNVTVDLLATYVTPRLRSMA